MQKLLYNLPYFESQKLSLFILIRSRAKALVLKELSSITSKRTVIKCNYSEIYFYIDLSTTFSNRPIFFTNRDLLAQQRVIQATSANKYHKVTKRILLGLRASITPTDLQPTADQLYSVLLSSFTDIFYFFVTDLGSLEPIVHYIILQLDIGCPVTLPVTALPQIMIMTNFSVSELESYILDYFFRLLASKIRRAVSTYFTGIRILALLPISHVSTQACHRRLKEYLIAVFDQVYTERVDSLILFSA